MPSTIHDPETGHYITPSCLVTCHIDCYVEEVSDMAKIAEDFSSLAKEYFGKDIRVSVETAIHGVASRDEEGGVSGFSVLGARHKPAPCP